MPFSAHVVGERRRLERNTMKFTKSKTINAPVNRVWQVLAHEFSEIGSWSSAVASSLPSEGDGPGDAPISGRVCSTPGFGDLEETITHYSEEGRELTFEVNGMPSFVTLARNESTVRPVGSDRSEVTFRTTMETNTVGKIMGPVFALKINSTLSTLLDELATFVEQGELSMKKAKQLAKAKG
jgi:Polyketide cyclase / dehydrase and lipid transport